MKALMAFIAVLALFGIAFIGASQGLQPLFGVIIPYAALALFIAGFAYRVIKWARSPVPFCIPTTCGQTESLPWIKQNKIDNPSTTLGVVIRMAFEVLLFRSLFRNLKAGLQDGRITYVSDKFLWAAGLAFHWSFLVIVFRHTRFFFEKVPYVVQMTESVDSFLQVGLPIMYMTDAVVILAVTYLFVRRVIIPQVSYISLLADFFPLFLILGIAITGVFMRYFTKTHIVGVKVIAMSIFTLKAVPVDVLTSVGPIFYAHFFLVCVLLMYFPFSKLMHMGGVFLSPTRNMVNNSRAVRHVNPWNYPVKVHTYEEYEHDFKDKMKSAGLPVEKE